MLCIISYTNARQKNGRKTFFAIYTFFAYSAKILSAILHTFGRNILEFIQPTFSTYFLGMFYDL